MRIADTVKPEAQSAIGELKKMNISTAMLTGDGQSSADAVAKALNIDEVHAKLLPADKLDMLQDIRTRRGSVMFVGDGINDAPVLAGADVGAAMGSGADAAIEAADVVYMTSSVEAIPTSLKIARADPPRCLAERVVRPGHQAHRHGAGPDGSCLHVDGRVRRFRRGHALRAEFHPAVVHEALRHSSVSQLNPSVKEPPDG